MNQVILIGRLTRDPELSYTPNTQVALCRFTLAVDRPRRNGEDGGADFIRITVWDKQAENCERYLSKGSQVAVRGRIETGSYKNRDGVTVYTTDVVADRFGGVEFLGSRSSNSGQGTRDSYPSAFDDGRGNYANSGNSGFGGGYGNGGNQGGQSYGSSNDQRGFGGSYGNSGNSSSGGFREAPKQPAASEPDFGGNAGGSVFGGFDDMPDSFQAAEDDIPF